MDKVSFVNKFKYYFDTSEPDANDNRCNNFNIVRIIAAFLVILGHMYFIMGQAANLPIFAGQGIQIVGVKILFVLCGYFITKSWLSDQHPGRYAIKRLFRIYPALIVLILLSILLLGPIMTSLSAGEYFSNAGTWAYLKNLILCPTYSLPGVFTENAYPNAVNGSLWTIPVELAIYVLVPLLTLIPAKKKTPIIGAVLLTLCIALNVCKAYLFPAKQIVFWGNDLLQATDLLPAFFLGHIFSFVDKKYFNWQIGLVAFLLISCLLVNAIPNQLNDLFFPAALAYFVLSFGNAEKPVFRNWFKKSDFSYGLYLYGFPIQQVMYLLLKKANLHPIVMTFICFVIVLGFAILSWYFVEKPANKLCQKILSYIPKRKKEETTSTVA